MFVCKLSKEMLLVLKQAYLTKRLNKEGRNPSDEELADADKLVSDIEILSEYERISFFSNFGTSLIF